MGIQGLLPLLKSIMFPIHIKDLEGCCVAVDTYSWLHKGALSCSKELCNGQPTNKHIDYCMHKVNLLRHYGVKPILVFDGGLLPMKSEQENKRARSRKENLARAIEHESCGNRAAAYECYQKAVDISPSVAYELIQVLKQENVYYVVAPYEADAEMTFLAVNKQVDAVITEDSDLVAFGCPRIIYKMDKFGQGVEFRYSMLQQNKDLNFTGFTKQMLLEMCILSGCDYLQSLPGMGLKKAYALMKKFKSYDKIIKHLKYSSIAVSPLYEESFKKAILTFQHQRVYDPVTEDIVHLSNLSNYVGEDLDFLGPSIPQHIAKGIASGDLDPFTKLPLQGECVRGGLMLEGTYQLKSFKPEGERKKLDLPAQGNLLTNYFCFASLEAKRKFRAPRITPKHPNQRHETPSLVEDITEETNSCKSNCSPAALPDSGNLASVPPSKDSVDNGVATKASVYLEAPSHGSLQHTLLQQSRHSLHPCIALHEEHECNSTSDGGEVKTRTENKTAIVSSYIQRKSSKENDQENKNENLSVKVKNDASTGTCECTVLECDKSTSEAGEGKTRVETKKIIVRSSYFQQKSIKGNDADTKNGMLLVTAAANFCESPNESKSASDAGKDKTRVENRKVIVRSSYFQHKSIKENDHDNKYEKFLVKEGVAIDTCENTIPESASSGNNHVEDTTMKRKFASIDSVQTENLNHKYMRTAPLPIQSNCTTNLDTPVMEMKAEEGKFGSNISHLGQYSDIAEKSMEKFVSVISSFRCSSGSRASGLRAPLKDVRNTCSNRSTDSMDLSKFAYVSTKHKASSASGRVYNR